jgi:hypothetical protein
MTFLSRHIGFSVFMVGFLLVSLAHGQDIATPEHVGMSAKRLQRITREAHNQIEKGNLVGTVLLVAWDVGMVVQRAGALGPSASLRVPAATSHPFDGAWWTVA